MKRAIRSLIWYPRRSIIETKDLKIPEKTGQATYSGVSATLFGGSSQVGVALANLLFQTGARCIYPFRSMETEAIGKFRDLRVHTNPGSLSFLQLSDFTDEKEIMMAIKDQNVVINCIGSRFYYKDEADYELANAVIPRVIAKCIKNSPHVKRFIHFSASGVDPHSPSIMLRTKWYGEQAVREYCPDATIIKPTIIYGTKFTESSFVGRFIATIRMTSGTGILIGDGSSKLQPVYIPDITKAVINALKMPESIGQTYELGGPVVYTYKELYETMFNGVNMKPYMVSVPVEEAFNYYNFPGFTSILVRGRVIFRKSTCISTCIRSNCC
eukprot:TRINITY_DN1374_c0_g1_i4.p1 TRINITY_DN1374_c0_g1~~TRINITY_DN1374_c0_g1_i4.p1  ORF type:complete len:327 (+),score=70.25 TRINITY_DN1374_c0_g1_i4:78-1058(+)